MNKYHPYDTTIPLLGIYARKTCVYVSQTTLRIREALFLIAPKGKQPEHPFVVEQLNKQAPCAIYVYQNAPQPCQL